jgi:hypothetical protein
MSARKLSIVRSNTFRGACGASADGALVALTATLALAFGVGLVALAETAGVDAVGSGSDLQAAATKPQAINVQPARHAIVAVAARRVNEQREGDES